MPAKRAHQVRAAFEFAQTHIERLAIFATAAYRPDRSRPGVGRSQSVASVPSQKFGDIISGARRPDDHPSAGAAPGCHTLGEPVGGP